MILQCPSCDARFLVSDALIPAAGRTVKCGKCTHQWFVAPPATDEVPIALPETAPDITPQPAATDFAGLTAQAYQEAVVPPHDPKQLPVVPVRPFSAKPFMIAAPLLAMCWAIIALYAYFPGGQHTPVIGGIYRALGVTSTADLVFEDVRMERENIGPRTRFLLSGSIANQGAAPRLLPSVRVEIKDANNEVIWSQYYDVNQTIEPGKLFPFRLENVETSFANRAASIVLDLGNNFELVMR